MYRWLLAGLLLLAYPVAAFDSGDIAPSGSWERTFVDLNPSGATYHCHPHPDMTGMVHVNADSDGATTTHTVEIVEGAAPEDWGYTPEHLVAEVGDTVRWVNTGALTHTVTEMDGEHGNHDHGDSSEHGDKGSPGLGLLASLTLLGLLVLARR